MTSKNKQQVTEEAARLEEAAAFVANAKQRKLANDFGIDMSHVMTVDDFQAAMEAAELRAEKAKAEAEAKAKAEAEAKAAQEAEEAKGLAVIVGRVRQIEADTLQYRVERGNLIWQAKTQYLEAVKRIYGNWKSFCEGVPDNPDLPGLGLHVGTVSNILYIWASETVRAAYIAGTIGDHAAITLGKAAAATGENAIEAKEVKAIIKGRETGKLSNDTRAVEAVKAAREAKVAQAKAKAKAALSPIERAEANVKRAEANVKYCREEYNQAKAEAKAARELLANLQNGPLAELPTRIQTVLIDQGLTTKAAWAEFLADDGASVSDIHGIGDSSAEAVKAAFGL